MRLLHKAALDRVIAYMMEHNREEIDKARGHFDAYGAFYLRYKEDGTVEAVHPVDFTGSSEP